MSTDLLAQVPELIDVPWPVVKHPTCQTSHLSDPIDIPIGMCNSTETYMPMTTIIAWCMHDGKRVNLYHNRRNI